MAVGKNIGFTLAEVLITLGIIGVVAAFTIPVLMNNIQNKQFAEAFKKDFSVISNAGQMARLNSGASLVDTLGNGSGSQCPTVVLENLKPYLKVSKFCSDGTQSAGNCWHPDLNWSNYQGDKMSISDIDHGGDANYGKSMILSDGTMILMHNPACINWNVNYFAMMLVDVNGFKAPNVIGRDIQNITIYSNVLPSVSRDQFKFVPGYNTNGLLDENTWCTTGTAGTKYSYGINCAKKIMNGVDY